MPPPPPPPPEWNRNGDGEMGIFETWGVGNGRAGQRLAPTDMGGVGEISPHDSLSKECDNSTEPELKHAPHGKPVHMMTLSPDPGSCTLMLQRVRWV